MISAAAITKLTSAVKGPLVLPDSPEYETAIFRFFADSIKRAGAVVYPSDEEDIGAVLKWAREEGVEVVVKGGGHTASGTSSTEGGVVIDLERSFRTVEVDKASSTALVGGGARWGDVDVATIKHGLAVVGGTNDDTGVAGLTLGGGYGWRTSDMGLVCDNVVEFKAVLANGAVVVVNETSEPDLFFALRGGGGSFGVVTQFKFRLYPQAPEVFFHRSVHLPTSLEKILAIAESTNKDGEDRSSVIVMNVTSIKTRADMRLPHVTLKPIVLVLGYFNGPLESALETFRPVNDLAPLQAMNEMIPYVKLNTMLNDHPSGLLVYESSLINPTFDAEALKIGAQKRLELMKEHPDLRLMLICFLPKFRKGSEVPWDATAIPHRHPEVCMYGFVCLFPFASDKARARSVVHQLKASLALRDSLGSYANIESDVRGRAEVFYGRNWDRLKSIKRKVDEEGVFGRGLLEGDTTLARAVNEGLSAVV